MDGVERHSLTDSLQITAGCSKFSKIWATSGAWPWLSHWDNTDAQVLKRRIMYQWAAIQNLSPHWWCLKAEVLKVTTYSEQREPFSLPLLPFGCNSRIFYWSENESPKFICSELKLQWTVT